MFKVEFFLAEMDIFMKNDIKHDYVPTKQQKNEQNISKNYN